MLLETAPIMFFGGKGGVGKTTSTINLGACLAEQGLRPDRLFDTELAARVAGLPRVGLAAVLEELLGVTLAKEHSAADWSVRPLPEAMLTYAALDVELLVPLREALIARLSDPALTARLRNTRIQNGDFEEFLDAEAPEPDDLVFLDPPYDGPFRRGTTTGCAGFDHAWTS